MKIVRNTLLIQVFVGLLIAASSWAGDKYPFFSWDRVPLYAHMGIGDGLTSEQYQFLADHFAIVTFTGGILKHSYSVEPNIAAAAKAVKERNPKVKVLFYWAADMPKHQWKISNASFPKGGYLRAKKGRRIQLQFDVRRQDVRDWWARIAGEAVHKYGCDGIFADGATAGRKNGPWSKMFGPEQAAAMDKGMFAMLRQAKEAMGPNGLIIFNPLHGYDKTHPSIGEPYLSVTDGAMIDDYNRATDIRPQSPEYLANTIEVMRKAAKAGKIIIFKAWPGFTWWSDKELMAKPHEEQYRLARERILFPLASFLVGAEKYCYFCYTWGWLPEYGAFDWYPEFDKPLGPPLGEAKRKGWQYRREFKHASVFVDLEKKVGKIWWK